MSSESYWVPQFDSGLFFAIANKSEEDEKEEHGLVLAKNKQVGGFTVVDITPGSAADRSELEKGDVIRTVNGVNVRSLTMPAIYSILGEAKKRLIFGIIRKNQEIEQNFHDIVLKKCEGDECAFSFIAGESWPRYEGDRDCFIHRVDPGGLGERAGLRVGDTLVALNGESLQNKDFGEVMRRILASVNEKRGVTLRVQRATFESFH